MSFEWFAVAASTVLGLAGMAATWLTARQGREHERRMAHEERLQQRRADTYLETLRMVMAAASWAQSVPHLDSGLTVGSSFPEVERQNDVLAELSAFGSADVGTLYSTWLDIVREMHYRARVIDAEIRRRDDSVESDVEPSSSKSALAELASKEEVARESLVRRINGELGHAFE